MNVVPAGGLKELLPLLDSPVFSPEVYRSAGVFVIRRALPAERVRVWQEAWRTFYEGLGPNRKIDPFNPVVVHETPPAALDDMHTCPELLDILERIYPDLALYMRRFLIKDRQSRTPVFLHHDYGYDIGWPEKTAVFIPLSPANPENGGMSYYVGTHRLGYLGDVGEFNASLLDPEWPVLRPSVLPGDVVFMHECTWHASGPHTGGPDRILLQATYQPASDPSGAALLRGSWRTDLRLAELTNAEYFKRCRSSRLRELQAEVNRSKT